MDVPEPSTVTFSGAEAILNELKPIVGHSRIS